MKAAVVGGGITGLACAYYLGQNGINATVFDPAPGGTIGTVEVEGCILDTGPESWLAAKPWAEQLLRELGLGDEITGSNDLRRKTYVLRDGRFEVLPDGLQMVVPTKVLPVLTTGLFGWGTRMRMGLEVFRNPKTLPDRSAADFVRDHFGEESVEYLAEPLLAGIYGGSPEDLSAPSVLPKFVAYEQQYGSVVVGTMRNKTKPTGGSIFKTMRRGLGTLIEALLARIELVHAPVEALRPEWELYAGGEWRSFDAIVLACGANRSAPLLQPVAPELGQLLGSIPYTGSSIWSFGYRREDIRHPLDAFGFLVPKPERHAIMACTWVQTKWVGRVPDDKAVFRCFSSNPEADREAMESDLRRLMGIEADPLFAMNHRWPNSMPQYNVGHTELVLQIEAKAREVPGLYLAGNSFHGIGIPDCVRSGREAAEAIARL